MRTFDFFITDDREAGPKLAFVSVSSPGRALQLAKERLSASPHHVAIEVREEGVLVGRVVRTEHGEGPGSL